MTRVAVTGHGQLSTSTVAAVEVALRRVLLPYSRMSRLTGVCGLAAGADQLFAQVVLELGGRLEVILPAADYRADHLGTGDSPQFERLLAGARSVRVMPFTTCSPRACMAARYAMLATVDAVVAVWDGHPDTGPGATAEVVALARGLGLPVSIIWPAGGAWTPAEQPAARPDIAVRA